MLTLLSTYRINIQKISKDLELNITIHQFDPVAIFRGLDFSSSCRTPNKISHILYLKPVSIVSNKNEQIKNIFSESME